MVEQSANKRRYGAYWIATAVVVMAVLAGCVASPGSADNGGGDANRDRSGGFYGGASGGWTSHP